MPITIKVDLTIRDDMVSDFHEMILEDQKSALESEDGVVLSFDIVNDETSPNDFTLYQTSTSKEGLHKHMKEHFLQMEAVHEHGSGISIQAYIYLNLKLKLK